MAYINLYEVTRAYAGPEEGGQWFNDAVVHYTIRVRGGIYSDRARRAFNAALARFGFTRPGRPLKRWERGSPTMRSIGQVDKAVLKLEYLPGKDWNDYQPYN